MAIVVYSAVAYMEYERAIKPTPSPAIVISRRLHSNNETPHPWFVEATAVAGGITVFTALLGLMAGCYPNVWTLNTYSFSLSALIIGQLGMLFAILIDKSWQTWPPDPSGEYDKAKAWIQRHYELSVWLGLALLTSQVFAVVVSCALSAAHQRLETGPSDDEEEDGGVWTPTNRRTTQLQGQLRGHPLYQPLSAGQAWSAGTPSGAQSPTSAASTTGAESQRGGRSDPWSRRMRDKYGLDVSVFTYDPEAEGSSPPDQYLGDRRTLRSREEQDMRTSGCAIA